MINRRELLAGLAVTAITSRANGRAGSTAPIKSLIPDAPSTAPNYWCTWAAQNYMYGQGLGELDPKLLEGESGSRLAHEALNESVLFGRKGWAETFFPAGRKDLYLLLDDGWESGGTATFEMDIAKFPSFPGVPSERLRKLNDAVMKAGWRGAALWCRNTPGGNSDYILERGSEYAGIHYWKIDIGDPAFHLMRVREETHNTLKFEHVHGESPLNGDWRVNGRFGKQDWGSRRMTILRETDVYRTYDVTSMLSLPTTLDRAAEMLKGAERHPEIHGLLNLEDEVYLAAALGCTMGVLRHPMVHMRPGADTDLFMNGPRRAKRRMDEVTRALRWQRVAPPFTAGAGSVNVGEEVLTDNWLFERGETWEGDLIGSIARQGAPACVARGIDLPDVQAPGEKPFVVATAFPNGAVAIAAQERTKVNEGWYLPDCVVRQRVAGNPGPFGIFGAFKSLTLTFASPLQNKRVLAQDLLGHEAIDISDSVQIHGVNLVVSGELIRRIGLQGATPGDLSSAGMILALRDSRG